MGAGVIGRQRLSLHWRKLLGVCVAIRYAARDTNAYEFAPVEGKPLPPYDPGAHIDLHLPNGLIRQYSLIEPEPDPLSYTVTVKRDPASRGGSRCVHDELRVGRTLKISAPRNNFPLVQDRKSTRLNSS